MHEYKTYYTEDGNSVRAYAVEEPHEVGTISGRQSVAPGVYVVQRDRPELHDVFPADLFESEHSENEPKDTDSQDVNDLGEFDTADADGEYDPSSHTVAEVQEYIRQHPDERDEVLAREREGGNRTTITG